MADPYSDKVVALLRMNGSDGATTFVDEVGAAEFTANGEARISTAVRKYGTGSLALDGAGDFLLCPMTATKPPLFNFGTGDFTIEAWVYLNAVDNNYSAIFCNGYTSWQSGARSLVYYGSAAPVTAQRNRFALSCYDNSSGPLVLSASTFTAGQWYHVALSRNGTTLRLFVNGTLQATSTSSLAMNFSASAGARIGGNGWDGATHGYWNGYIDDLRVTAGLGRYTAAFTPPAEELEYTPTNAAWLSSAEAGAWVAMEEGLAVSSMETGAWVSLQDGLAGSSLETGAWLSLQDGVAGSGLEIGAWLDLRNLTRRQPVVNLIIR